MGTKNISLPPDLERYVDAKVAAGEYAHASEVVRDGIRLLIQKEAEKLAWLRAAVREGLDSAVLGELTNTAVERIIGEGRAAFTRRNRGRRKSE